MWFFISLVVTPTSKGQQLCLWIENINTLWYQFFNFDLWNFISHKLIAVQQKKFLWRLHQHVKANGAAIQAHSMCSSALLGFPASISFCDILRHGSQIDGSGPELHQGEQGQDSTHATRCVKGDRNGSSRSACQGVMALSQQPCSKQLAEEPSRHVATLSGLQPRS